MLLAAATSAWHHPVCPCAALCTCPLFGRWVLQTLAQHCEDCDVWIPLVNEIAALVRLGACAPETEETVGMIKGLLYSLIDVYESLRMCEAEDGYIARQLNYKYTPATGSIAHPLLPSHLPPSYCEPAIASLAHHHLSPIAGTIRASRSC